MRSFLLLPALVSLAKCDSITIVNSCNETVQVMRNNTLLTDLDAEEKILLTEDIPGQPDIFDGDRAFPSWTFKIGENGKTTAHFFRISSKVKQYSIGTGRDFDVSMMIRDGTPRGVLQCNGPRCFRQHNWGPNPSHIQSGSKDFELTFCAKPTSRFDFKF